MTLANRNNPFGLTYRECELLEALIRLGSAKGVAYEEQTNEKTIRNTLRTAVKKIGKKVPGVVTTLQAAIQFDRKRREGAEFQGRIGTANSVFALAANEERSQA
jgi:DNA-binding CsgD family transcriptional regulator